MNGAVRAVAIDEPVIAPASSTDALGVLAELSLARISAENGATRADLLRDLASLTSHRLSPSELRQALDDGLSALLAAGAIVDLRGRFRLEDAGVALISQRFGDRDMPASWAEIRDIRLVAAALGAAAEPHTLKALDRADGLRAIVLQKAFGVKGKRVLGASRLRTALAVVALERAFGNKIKSGFDAGRGLSVKASRLLAGQLARRPRDFGTDTRLITALAAEAVGATQSDPHSLRQAILRRYVSERLNVSVPLPLEPTARPAEPPKGRPGDVVFEVLDRPAAANRPDLEGFVKAVLSFADAEAEGWPGNRKAFIVRVWRAISAAHAEWGLSDIEFKGMLAEAHRTGHLVLGSADIKNKDNLADVQEFSDRLQKYRMALHSRRKLSCKGPGLSG